MEKFITTDGFKFLLPNNEWVAFRASGTEPVFRCYIEAKSKKHLEELRKAAEHSRIVVAASEGSDLLADFTW